MADGIQVVGDQNAPEVYQTYNTDAHGHGYPVHSEKPPQQPATIFNIPRRTFWILVAVIGTIVAATIAGSIGGSLAAKSKCTPTSTGNSNSDSNSNSTTATTSLPLSFRTSPSPTTYYTPLPLSEISLLNVSCPSNPLDSLLGLADKRGIYTYDCRADQDIPGSDITGFSAYSLQQCVDACSQFNEYAQKRTCRAVVIGGNVDFYFQAGSQENCWLKTTGIGWRAKSGTTLAVLRGV